MIRPKIIILFVGSLENLHEGYQEYQPFWRFDLPGQIQTLNPLQNFSWKTRHLLHLAPTWLMSSLLTTLTGSQTFGWFQDLYTHDESGNQYDRNRVPVNVFSSGILPTFGLTFDFVYF